MYPYAISMLVYIDGYYGVTITTTDVIDIADTCIEMHQTSCIYTCVNRCSILLSVPLSNYIHVFQRSNNCFSGIHVCSWKEGQKVKWSICLHMYIYMRSGAFLYMYLLIVAMNTTSTSTFTQSLTSCGPDRVEPL